MNRIITAICLSILVVCAVIGILGIAIEVIDDVQNNGGQGLMWFAGGAILFLICYQIAGKIGPQEDEHDDDCHYC